ncbi:hypothetical protein ACH79_16220 [Bradyrhizobium sp. CCBAU 051011]|uniref:hypothetical protein n=1 Tax=Bradyrhizobium sp. CCBAU 051011 TaxID=858422 RepID=UPI001374279C|nr:hypothetical protein [Bradyrhizobium sp. CCBAU 051011]QHO73949.1 hypothetical protein ACH79_16220 [Bradyrhizobium sp. CCBAU 051011]
MLQIFQAIFAALAVTATLGAVQFASGHDLTGGRELASPAPAAGINRAGKADRAGLKVAPGETETITIRTVGLEDTSVVVRVPVVKDEARNRLPPPAKPGKAKTAIACEPPVSVLTEVAKLLQPGRCLT